MQLSILFPAIVNGILNGALYALVALGLTLVYGVLHIINFAHGTLLTAALFTAFYLYHFLGIDPYIALVVLTPAFFLVGYALQRLVIGPLSHGDDSNILLVTLGLAVIIENGLLFAFRGDTRTVDLPYSFAVVPFAGMFISVPRLVGFGGAVTVAVLLWLLLTLTDTGKAIRAVAKEKLGAQLSGIDVAHIYALTFGLGTACVAVAACLLIPTYYVNPHVGNAYVLVAFTTVVLGGMGSIPGALIGGLFVGLIESLCGLYLGESLGQIGIFLMFILVLLFVQADYWERAHEPGRVLADRCGGGGACLRSARRSFGRGPEFSGDSAVADARGAGLEHARRLWWPIFLWSRRVFRHRRLRDRHPANSIWPECVARFRARHRGRRRHGSRDWRFDLSIGAARVLLCARHARLRRGSAHSRQRRARHRSRASAS